LDGDYYVRDNKHTLAISENSSISDSANSIFPDETIIGYNYNNSDQTGYTFIDRNSFVPVTISYNIDRTE